MRLIVFLLTVALLQAHAKGVAQNVTLSGNSLSLKTVFRAVEKQTGYYILCSLSALESANPVSVSAKDVPLEAFLKEIFKSQPTLKYAIREKNIFVTEKSIPPRKESSDQPVVFIPPPVSGIVMDSLGRPLPGATIRVKGKKIMVTSGESGHFSILADKGDVLIVSFVGYREREIKIGNEQTIRVVLVMEQEAIEEVVINMGIIKRDKTSFTGAATVYTGTQLKAVGNRNVLESLRSLDPSFVKVENNLQGSNPNSMPNFEIRGQTTINTNTLNDQFNQDPNQPLFILDGFETTLQTIYDLDMNRVASITILKDAASTALYGARAANGVVVVETRRPVPGKLQMSYASDLTLEMPDLNSYNLMNGAEKLEYERLQGLLYGPSSGQSVWENNAQYNKRLGEVQRGVNTYWINEPVRIGLSQRQSLQLTGGNNEFVFSAAASYGNQLGVMKGSGRKTWGGNVMLSYRKGKINVNNQVSFSGTNAKESPYGSFSVFAQAIPYYRKQLPDGTIPKYLDPEYDPSIVNPLYDASLTSVNNQKSFSFFNNLNALYYLSRNVRIQGGLQLAKGNSNSVVFIPPDNSQFDKVELRQKGSYTSGQNESYSYNANLMINYGQLFGRSQFNASIRGNISEANGAYVGFSAVGFPYGTNGNPIYAYSYTPYSTPSASNTKTRSEGFLASINYAWDQRFMFDAVYRLDGASVFGSDHTFKPFVSGGVGWNIHKEPLLKGSKIINLLKLRANAGWTGNENLGQFSSISTYNFLTGNNNAFGQGLTLASLGNPALDWQRTLQLSYGVDFAFWNNRVSGYVEYFDKKTDPLAISAEGTLPSSTGTGSNFVINVGYLQTRGWNFNLRVLPVNIPAQRIVWSLGLTGNSYKSTYGGLADRLAKLNEQETKDKGLLRYHDGYSPDDLWAVISYGVDPATGSELFLKKDGSLTFSYNTDDIVRVGNSRPTLEGGINTSFTYREFTFSAVARYRIGGYVFNSALYNKVENVNFQNRVNLDKRALYDRWKEPGDIAQFTAINSNFAYMSSRFVQKDNHLIGESFSLSWRSYAQWIRKLKLQSLSLTMYLNDIFRLEKVKTERGIDYPYARTASLSLNVTF